jgi:predicted DNA-binding protein (MmcQ/YjbR family)
MSIEDVRLFCLNKKGVTESFPFDDTTLVFKVVGKMFALVNLSNNQSINLKCDPDKALVLREHYPAVLPGYHMNKKLWNTIVLDNSIPDSLIREWIDDSYVLIVEKMTKKLRNELNNIIL